MSEFELHHKNDAAENQFIDDIKSILANARHKVYSTAHAVMVEAYWHIGKRIVEQEQNGKERAEYGKQLLKRLSGELTLEFDKGLDERELRRIRQFYSVFPIRDALRPELTWSHYRSLIRVQNPKAREYYLTEAACQYWKTRTLDRNISTQYYERIVLSQVKDVVKNEMIKKTQDFQENKMEFIKNPYLLEFIGVRNDINYLETDIENALISHIQQFLLELGKGYAFVARQKMIRTETSEYFIDLVFYNFILNCFVLIDLKSSKITHQDVGQMDMYVRMFDELQKNKTDNPTLGIILCSETDVDVAKYSILKGNEHLFASKYRLYLPSEKELAMEIEREKQILHEKLNDQKMID
jgi:predicted nuclease of restriction endonuclease-like (RecB) superfamily